MSTTRPPLNIFLATPGDLGEERKAISSLIDRFNRRRTPGVTFKLLEWTQVRGGVGRPQEQINQLIHESHYMIVLFKSRWGSNPGSPWKFSSGTEEELFTGLLDLGNNDRPMRDVWTGFLNSVNPDASVQNLRLRLTTTSQIMYEALSDQKDLESKLEQVLGEWTKVPHKVPKRVKLLPESGRDVLGPAWKMQAGLSLIQAGETPLGRRSLKKAAKQGGAEEKLAYAAELTRTSNFLKAQKLTQTAIDIYAQTDNIYTAAAADAFRRKANLLRLQNLPEKAELVALKAIERAKQSGPEARPALAALHDELGLCYKKMDKLDDAETHFRKSLEIREEDSSPEAARSQVKLCRMLVAREKLDDARLCIDKALEAVKERPASEVKADAHLANAQLSLRQGRLEDALDSARQAVHCNRFLGNQRGETMSLYVQAQILNAREDPAAESVAKEVYERNERVCDTKGMQLAEYQIRKAQEIRQGKTE